ncbi:hypothetical protein ABZV67_07915 [Streptomyces sp. NPDC005065]|uniref:hypothetical protein n=1 Tax=unclassified Streptomyces TaxID=2593676 RepID=UPI0033B1EC6A
MRGETSHHFGTLPRRIQRRHTFIASVPREGALRTPYAPGLDDDDNWADED